MTGDAAAESASLSDKLLESIKAIHGWSNGVVVVRAAAVFTSRELYGQALSCFFFVFTALEEGLEALRVQSADGTALHALLTFLPQCYRKDKLAADLNFLLGPKWESLISPTAAVTRYVTLLRRLREEFPAGLVAHSFHQYMGLNAGGRMLARTARKELRLEGEEGTQFYHWEGIKSETARAIKEAVNGLGTELSASDCERMVAEGLNVFYLNNAIILEFPIGWRASARSAVMLLTLIPWRLRLTACAVGVGLCAATIAYVKTRALV